MIDLLKCHTSNTGVFNTFRSYFNGVEGKTVETPPKDGKHAKFIEYFEKDEQTIEFERIINSNTGSVMYENLNIELKPHYLFNQMKHNANEFSPIDCIKTLTEFFEPFNADLSHLQPCQLETGTIFNQPYRANEIIQTAPYHSKHPRFDLGGAKTGYQYHPKNQKRKTHYKTIKFYCKGLQNKNAVKGYCKRDTLRFEIKTYRYKKINDYGIYSVQDLLNVDTYLTLIEALKAEFEALLILDTITPIEKFKFDKRQINRFENYLNPNNWEHYIEKMSRNTYNRKFKDYNLLLLNYPNNIKSTLKNQLFQQLEKYKNGALRTYTIGTNRTKKRICPVTGIDISNQKQGSSLLSNTGLKLLEENEPLKFRFLQNILLTGNYNKFENTIYDKMSKQIRNKYYNNPSKYNSLTLFK